MGAPKKRLMWLDIGDPNTPVLVWQDGDVLDRARVKDKDRMSLIDIIDIKAGQVSAPLRRSGRVQHADKYLSFTAEDRTFDVEAATVEGRDWLFKKFADLFQAYATAKIEGRQGDSATLRVSELMDGGAAAAAAAANDVGSPRGRSTRGRDSPRDAGGYYDGGGGGMGGRRRTAGDMRGQQDFGGGGGYGGGGYY